MHNLLSAKRLLTGIGVLVVLSFMVPVNSFAKLHGFKNLSTIISPQAKATIAFEPVDIVVQLKNAAQPDTFKAWLNGKNITANFTHDETLNQMTGIVGPEDGLRIQSGLKGKFKGLNILKTKVNSLPSKKIHKRGRKLDVDVRAFRVKSRGLTRKTAYGEIRGLESVHDTWAWLGVPYAKAPVGDLRWRAPKDPESWNGVKETTEKCSECTQPYYDARWHSTTEIIGSEDCLYMNIYRPNTGETNLPVYLYIHGGANIFGSAKGYNGEALANRGNMIVIMINYRLNAMGWLTHPALRDDEDTLDASGNYGTLDAIQALKWVKANITAFGGNPENITVGGQSAGAHNTTNLIMSPLASGLFQKAALQSNAMTLIPLSDGDERTNGTIDYLLIQDGLAADAAEAEAVRAGMSYEEIDAYLRGKDADVLMTAQIMGPGGGSSPYGDTFRDGTVIPDATWMENIAAGAYNKMPILIGTTEYEWQAFMPLYGLPVKMYFGQPSGAYSWHELYNAIDGFLTLDDVLPTDRDKEIYKTTGLLRSRIWKQSYCDSLAKAFKNDDPENPVYTYLFKWDGGGDPSLEAFEFAIGSGHSTDVSFFQGSDHDTGQLGVFTENNQLGRVALQNAMMDYLAQFVSTGNPNSMSLPQWPQWSNTEGEPKGISLDADLENLITELYSTEVTAEALTAEIYAAYALYPEAAAIFGMFGVIP